MLIGSILRDRYKIMRLLGKGGFGDTYLAEDSDLPDHPLCVVKHFQPKSTKPAVLPIARRLFDREAQVLYRLGRNHDQIPTLFAHFEEKGEFYLVQEFIDGDNLTKEVYPGNKLNEKQLQKLLREILEVLAYVHQQNIIHRDIKPQNIMRRRQDGQIVLIDFGAVREISAITVNSQGQSSLTVIVGSPGYMPNEQAAGQPKLSSDVCALGMLGIFALTGIRPHEFPKDPTNGEVIWRAWAKVNEEMAQFLDKMIRYNFSERYQSAGEALIALNTIIEPLPQIALPLVATVQPGLLQSKHGYSRRYIIQTLGFMAAGFSLALITERLMTLRFKSRLVRTINNLPIASSILDQRWKTFPFQVVMVDKRGNTISKTPGEARYLTEYLGDDLATGNSITLDMVQIPKGNFIMGSPKDETPNIARPDENPQHHVEVPEFFLGKYEVTQEQYKIIMGNNPAYFQVDAKNHPVEQVSWDDAQEFCRRLSKKTGRPYRLPSEAEWEYACRGGTTTPFYTGATITVDLANYDSSTTYAKEPTGQARNQTTVVGQFPPNPFGLYDMSGNVSEWCFDYFHANYQGAPRDGSSWIKNKTENYRIIRGGSWSNIPAFCRSANRLGILPVVKLSTVGFRLAMNSL